MKSRAEPVDCSCRSRSNTAGLKPSPIGSAFENGRINRYSLYDSIRCIAIRRGLVQDTTGTTPRRRRGGSNRRLRRCGLAAFRTTGTVRLIPCRPLVVDPVVPFGHFDHVGRFDVDGTDTANAKGAGTTNHRDVAFGDVTHDVGGDVFDRFGSEGYRIP